MSAIVAVLDPGFCAVAMDTLSVSIDKKQRWHLSKCLLVPHLRMVICCVGLANLLHEWHSKAIATAQVRDITELDRYTPSGLLQIAQGLAWMGLEVGIDPPTAWERSAAIYHFGYSHADKAMVGYAYRSEKLFASERLEYSWRRRGGDVDNDGLDGLFLAEQEACYAGERTFADACIRIITAQKAREDMEPPAQRCDMGGEIHLVHLTEDMMKISIIHRFPDAGTVPILSGEDQDRDESNANQHDAAGRC